MKDAAGNYYWSGGVEKPVQDSIYPWWLENSFFSIPALWPLASEQIVKVAILDTGISRHVDFDFSKITGFNYLPDSGDYQSDIDGHGTHCAGIIAAKGIKSYGVAPETHLFVAKVCDDYGRPVITSVKNALNDIYLEKNGCSEIRIINMSFNMPARNDAELAMIKDIENLITKLSVEKQCIIVCSSGDITDIDDSFPAEVEECIAVGSINSKFIRSPFSRKTSILDIMAPGEEILSCNNTDSTIMKSGTSQAAAFVTGVCSLAMQKMKKATFSKDLFKKILFQTAYSNSFSMLEYGHGIIEPNKFIETI